MYTFKRSLSLLQYARASSGSSSWSFFARYASSSCGVISSFRKALMPSMIDSITFRALFPISKCSKPKASMLSRVHTSWLGLLMTLDEKLMPESRTLSLRTSRRKGYIEALIERDREQENTEADGEKDGAVKRSLPIFYSVFCIINYTTGAVMVQSLLLYRMMLCNWFGGFTMYPPSVVCWTDWPRPMSLPANVLFQSCPPAALVFKR